MDQEVAKAEVDKPDASGRRSRRKKDTAVQKTIEPEGHGTADGQGTVSESAPDDGQVDGSAETATEQPKTRRRKDRTVKAEETSAETEKPSEMAENAPQEASLADSTPEESAVSAEAPKRRRRRKTHTVTEADMHTDHTLDITDDDLPF